MTRQQTFKRRVRARMEKTGERYNAARRALLTDSAVGVTPGRVWASAPEVSDDAVREATGRGWNEWCDIIDAGPGSVDDHTAVAAWLEAEGHVDGWWAQTVTVGWERITGRRLPHQMPDGTFTANKTRTVSVDAGELRSLLLDGRSRADLFPGHDVELRSNPETKSIRLGLGDTVALVAITPKGDRAAINVQHSKLPTFDDVERWKFYWDEWLEAIDEA